MFAVVGLWDINPDHPGYDPALVRVIAAGVAHAPGLVQGFWSQDDAPSVGHTFIVFDDRANAEAFAVNVTNNAANQANSGITMRSLSVTTISATT